MSTGPLSIVGSAAGTPLAQAKGSEVSRAQLETSRQARQADSVKQAEDAAGIGKTDEDEQTSERDADGRRLWEIGPDGKRRLKQTTSDSAEPPSQSKDPTGQSGQQLDLSG